MATSTYTAYDIGIRRNIKTVAGTILGERNFEPVLATANPATVAYEAKVNNLWWVDGNVYNAGTALPYDANAGASYSTTAKSLLVFYWDNILINCTT